MFKRFKKNSKQLRFLSIIGVLALVVTTLAACGDDASASEASCALVRGNGYYTDTNVHKVILPGQRADSGSDENVKYLYCNDRNYISNLGDFYDPNGDLVGDRHIPYLVTAPNGVMLEMDATIHWKLNQNEEALRQFAPYCAKFPCWNDEDKAGDINSSSEGWNDMLSETFPDPLQMAARIAIAGLMADPNSGVTEAVYMKQDVTQIPILQNEISKQFMSEVRKPTGETTLNFFCGAGDASFWPDAKKPGKDDYHCGDVGIEITSLRVAPDSKQTPDGLLITSKWAHDAAVIKYGDLADEALLRLDTIEACKDAAVVTCIINGEAGGIGVVIPPPTPEPTATKED